MPNPRPRLMPEHANDNKKLGEVYTFDEVCAKLKIGRRSLSELIAGTNFFSRKRRMYRFSDADVMAIWESMRCASTSTNVHLDRTTSSGARTVKAVKSSNLRKLLTKPPRKKSA
jgi:hypothetical protein